MKTVEIKVPIKVTDDFEYKVEEAYEEPENMNEAATIENALTIFNAGLRQLTRNKIKAANNFGPVARKLFEMKIHPTPEAALNWILEQKGIKKPE